MNRNMRMDTHEIHGRGRSMGIALITVLLAAIFIFGAWNTARAQATAGNDREAVWATIDTVFEGWRGLNLNLYMSVWDNTAVQYLKKGTTRNYDQIRADRAAAFPTYSRVDASWIADSIEVYGDKATVVVRYSMTFYKKDGRVIRENEKEFYVLKKYPDGMWSIVENYDYLPR
jgi:hypothetical protein